MSAVLQASFHRPAPTQTGRPALTKERDAESTCISNISPGEGRKRLIGGVILFVITLAILAALITTGADRLWRLPLFFLFWGAASGFFQWWDKT